MSLSVNTKFILECAMANAKAAKELADAVDSLHAISEAATIAAISSTNMTAAAVAPTTFTASAGVFAVPAEPTGAEVDSAIDAATAKVKAVVDIKADNVDLETLRTEAEARIDAVESKINAILVSLKNAHIMAV